GNLLGDFVVVAHAVIESKIASYLPRVLREPGNRLIADSADRIAEALNKVRRKSQAVLLHGRKVRWRERAHSRKRSQSSCRQATEIKETSEVQLKNRFGYANPCVVAAKLERVIAGDEL